jgi:TfoX/Sxy family transcriptional regulator of competence genes
MGGAAMTGHASLADRIRAMLTDEPSTREVRMFGGLSFMVNGKMVVAVHGDSHLLVHIDPDRNGELRTLPGARPAEMGAGRTMGPGWLCVAEEALATDDDLSFWTEVALEYNAQICSGPR